jgi:hypothetical protein
MELVGSLAAILPVIKEFGGLTVEISKISFIIGH